jgi:hypothetical protein
LDLCVNAAQPVAAPFLWPCRRPRGLQRVCTHDIWALLTGRAMKSALQEEHLVVMVAAVVVMVVMAVVVVVVEVAVVVVAVVVVAVGPVAAVRMVLLTVAMEAGAAHPVQGLFQALVLLALAAVLAAAVLLLHHPGALLLCPGHPLPLVLRWVGVLQQLRRFVPQVGGWMTRGMAAICLCQWKGSYPVEVRVVLAG